ncbi:MAG TPA: hypothetical protein DHW42_05005 [Candidatus Marinimicrobia bacterium]|nr:hypothetical protein [Candidatus Neomarinimicrobiota bacterium]
MKKLTGLLLFTMLIVSVSAQTDFATVFKTSGSVYIKPSGENEFNAAAEIGMKLNIGDAIMTTENGFVVVLFNKDKSLLKIRKNSEVSMQEEFSIRTIKISSGRVLAQVTPGIKGSFRIETPTSVASVKGTKFWSVVSPQYGDRFYGIEGNVNIVNLITGAESNMAPGQMVISTPQGQLINLPIDETDMPRDIDEKVPVPEKPESIQPEEEVYKPKQKQPASVAAVPTTPSEIPQKEPKQAAKKPYGMGLGLGSVTIDNKIYNQIALRPELKMGKLGIALDVAFYMDEQGNIRKDEWDEFSDYLDKFYYVRWAQQGDPFFAKLGAIDNVTLGYGILMNGYSNTTEYPQIRKVGVHTGMQIGNLSWEAFIANAKEMVGLVAGRVTYQPLEHIPVILGGSMVMDVNQYKGMKDTDKDDVPDIFDAFPMLEFELPRTYPSGYNNFFPGDYLKGRKYDLDSDDDGIPDQLDWDIDGDGLTDNHPDINKNVEFGNDIRCDPKPFNMADVSKTLAAVSFDVGYPALNLKFMKLFVYGQTAGFISGKVTDYNSGVKYKPGWGFAAPGLKMNFFKFVNLTLEYRVAGENFLYNFWDKAYDYERVSIRTKPDRSLYPYTKDEMRLFTDASQGVFGAFDVNILNYIILGSYYQHMFSSGTELKSFMATASIPKGKIPKLAEAMAFYQRNNDDDPFRFNKPSENTILGYKIGFELGGGAVIYYVFQKTYRDYDGSGSIDPKTESVSITSIETGFTF